MLYENSLLERLERSLRAVLPAWKLSSDGDLRLLTISENATFLAEEGGRRVVLRVHRPGYHSEAEIRSELSWIEALRRDGVVETPRPLRAEDGELLVRFMDGPSARYAVAFEHMSGREPEATSDLPHWYRHLGEISARLHDHARRWTRPADFVRKRWDFETILGRDAYWGDWRAAPGLDGEGLALLERLQVRLEAECRAAGQGGDRFGLVHCDMRAANLLVEGDRLGVIDFDDCGLSWFGYDFAASISFIEHEPIVPALRQAWLEGYARVSPFPEEQARLLPMFVMLRRMQLTAWIASHAETPTALALGPAFSRGTVDLARAYMDDAGASVGADEAGVRAA
ncbi:phosphotransferase enzyme family protein [Aureimonas sp. Leaf427]|nr:MULTISPECIES: phosphotransferase [unclassified Aureimonas]KQT69826.1 aminoglycoside phosphotransferase [Aureimonas sp. Leaf427]KQT76022.1 aminoglycoside phosphotransferase [Aureimonas sp. Leaf460]